MRVKLIRKDTVEDFIQDHQNGKVLFLGWLNIIKYAEWETANDITSSYKGNLLGNGCDRVVFDVGGNGKNAYRIICGYKFDCPYSENVKRVNLYVNWIGTHEEYNALTADQKRTISHY